MKKRVKAGRKNGICMMIAAMMTCLLFITSCGGNLENDILGTWYETESTIAPDAFVLYSDGTCEISGEYGSGTWSLVNENQLKLVNYYGEVIGVYEVKDVSDDSLIMNIGFSDVEYDRGSE